MDEGLLSSVFETDSDLASCSIRATLLSLASSRRNVKDLKMIDVAKRLSIDLLLQKNDDDEEEEEEKNKISPKTLRNTRFSG